MSRPRTAPSWAVRAAALSLIGASAVTGLAALGAQALPSEDRAAEAVVAGEAPGATPERGPDVDMETLGVPLAGSPVVVQHEGDRARVAAHLTTTRTDYFGLVGVTWPAEHDARGLHVEIRTHDAGGWSDWDEVPVETVDVRHEPGARAGTLPAWVGGADGIAVRMLSDDGTAPEDVRVALIDGGTGLAEEPEGDPLPEGQVGRPAPTLALGATAEGSGVAQPDIVLRDEWGVDSSTEVECSAPQTADTMRGIVLHHTAGSNDYTPEQAPGIVRAIHRYHTVSQGWCDLGYNFLVDKYGTVYEGRRGGITNQVRGAHAGDALVNKWTTGISMMGHFEATDVPTALKDAVVRLSAWRLWLFGRDATGTMLIDDKPYPRLAGHRDFKATACPGEYGYAWLNGGLREEVQAILDAAGDPPPPEPEPTPTPTPTEPPAEEPAPEPTVVRYAGADRYATAAEATRRSFPGTTDTVFLASGAAFPDALSGGPAASLKGAPLLLVRPEQIPAETAAELARLQPATIYVLGGEGAVGRPVVDQARQYTATVTRLAGANRYATGVAIAQELWGRAGTVYLASGEAYPDALSGGALAAVSAAPVLLTGSRWVPVPVGDELKRLAPSTVVLLGGTGAVSEQVAAEVARLLPGASVQRVGGADRFATSAAIAERAWQATGGRVYLAAGTDFPDALAGVPSAGRDGAPLLLSRRACLPQPVDRQVDRLSPGEAVVLGGEEAVSDQALTSPCSG